MSASDEIAAIDRARGLGEGTLLPAPETTHVTQVGDVAFGVYGIAITYGPGILAGGLTAGWIARSPGAGVGVGVGILVAGLAHGYWAAARRREAQRLAADAHFAALAPLIAAAPLATRSATGPCAAPLTIGAGPGDPSCYSCPRGMHLALRGPVGAQQYICMDRY